MIDDGHLEVVEGGHQIVQFGSGCGGAGCVGKHRGVGLSGGGNLFIVKYLLFLYGVGLSGGFNLFLVKYLLFLYFLGSGDQDMLRVKQ